MIHYPIKKFEPLCTTFDHVEPDGTKVYRNKKRYKEAYDAKAIHL